MNTYTEITHERLKEQARELDKLADEMRRQEFLRLRAAGWSMPRIGEKYNLTRQRVEQILKGRITK